MREARARRTAPAVGVTVALLAFVGCAREAPTKPEPQDTALPAPTELAAPAPGIAPRIERVSAQHGDGEPADLASALRREVDAIAGERGDRSLAHAEAALAAGIALTDGKHFALARAFFAERLALCESLLGVDHRETAFALNDLAVVEGELAGERFSPEAERLLRQALAVRLRVLGADHPETAGAKLFLASLLTHAQRRSDEALAEASSLASEARAVFKEPLPDRDAIWTSEVAGHVALLQGDAARALEILKPVISYAPAPDDFAFELMTIDARKTAARALRALGRETEAMLLEETLPLRVERSGSPRLGD